jgi:SAM-dependent methyltransferase
MFIAQLHHKEGDQAPLSWTTGVLERLPVGLSLLDVACGSGRLVRWAATRGFKVLGLDVDENAVVKLKSDGFDVRLVNLETGPTPSPVLQFDCVVINRYWWRSRMFQWERWLKPDGILIVETFAQGNGAYGRPSRDDFLLQPGELLKRCQLMNLRVLAYEDGFIAQPNMARIQRVCAIGAQRRVETMPLIGFDRPVIG